MASGTVYSSWSANWTPSGSSVAKRFRTFLKYSTSESATAVSVTVSMGIELNSSVGVTFSSSSITNGGTTVATSSSNKTTYKSSGAQLVWTWISSRTITLAKTTSSYTRTISATSTSSSASWNAGRTASLSVTVPALASYAVTYDANGGTGTVAGETKWYGQGLTLAGAQSGFTRQYHTLTGWNTAPDGSGTAYGLEATYTGNAALALYAQWHLDYMKPTMTDLDCFRVDSSAAAAESMSGEYIRVAFDYTGGTVTGGESYVSPTCVIKINSTQVYSGTLSASGSFAANFGTYTANSAHDISVQLYDSYDQTGISISEGVGSAMFPIDILGDGTAMGIMTPAVAGQALKLFVDAIYPVGSYYETSDTSFDPNTYFGGSWTLETEGQVHVSAGSNYVVNGALSNSTDGGASTVKLAANQIPTHTHDIWYDYWTVGSGGGGTSRQCLNINAGASTYKKTTNAQGGSPGGSHNNMQPYIVVNRWHRTA